MSFQEKQTTNEDLNDTQLKIWETLNGPKYHEWPLGKCYLGAIRVIDNQNNPDRFAQAAHSLRELFEKLPQASSGNVQKQPPFDFKQKAIHCLICLNKDKERYSSGWEKQTIDTELIATLDSISSFFNNYIGPSRMDKIILAYQNNPSWLNESSPEEFKKIWNKLQRIAHHSSDEQSKCEQLLKECDIFLNRLLCPTTD